ncbi:hypothetical protein HYO99_gp24 [Roseobacter phage RD-1410W1-01]|uniref:Uncharacterized protein n=1 Tax=Roseobacter phage RD-1410W1-01 TaxID=1815984 RepID=A0A191VYH0_9CAUD|nr:hypothetical protein HYO99_gp24 [Roseobacter phage RD-1410W1-01]ANJ20758.1 hypothetical protein RDp01_gp24 [Roseobacter phage RD-1410W1-01]
MLNRQNFLFKHEAEKIGTKLLQGKYATRIGVEKDLDGYWLNVWWRCGIIAPLTLQETEQLLGETKC